jgi:hypothetical protein
MTIKEKFLELAFAKISSEELRDECEKIADEFAIAFAMSISTHCYCELGNDTRSYQELLEIYKKEKGL